MDSKGDETGYQWDFFLAHAGADRDSAERLYDLLVPHCRVFLDSKCLLPGDDWDRTLSQAQRSSRITLVLISGEIGKAYYEREEIATAIALARENENLHRVVPIFLERLAAGAAIPYGLRLKHGIFQDQLGGMPGVAQKILDLLARLTRDYTSIRVIPAEEYGVAKVSSLAQKISYKNLSQSRRALNELKNYVVTSKSESLREAAISVVKDFLALGDFDGTIVPRPVREIRRLALDTIRALAQKDLGAYFQEGELDYLDLYGMDFARQQLAGVTFRYCFLVESSFEGAVLDGSSFLGAYIRNVKFAGASLRITDLTDADWFNAQGLKPEQLREARLETLLACPPDVEGMHRYLRSHYAVTFERWSEHVQKQLTESWAEYLNDGGLRYAVSSWKQKAG